MVLIRAGDMVMVGVGRYTQRLLDGGVAKKFKTLRQEREIKRGFR
jgi:hypothetical protein